MPGRASNCSVWPSPRGLVSSPVASSFTNAIIRATRCASPAPSTASTTGTAASSGSSECSTRSRREPRAIGVCARSDSGAALPLTEDPAGQRANLKCSILTRCAAIASSSHRRVEPLRWRGSAQLSFCRRLMGRPKRMPGNRASARPMWSGVDHVSNGAGQQVNPAVCRTTRNGWNSLW
jgi:hypothetical protein